MNILQLRIILRFKVIAMMVAFLFLSSAFAGWSRTQYLTPQSASNETFYYRVDSSFQQRWVQRFAELQDKEEYLMSNAVESFVQEILMLIEQFPKEGKIVVEAFGSIRRYMPEEFRWALAALEVEAGMVKSSTLVDLKSAATRAGFADETGKMGILSKAFGTFSAPFVIYCPPLKGETRTREAIMLGTTELSSFLMSKWHMIAMLDPQNSNLEIERKRLEWISDIVDSTSRFSRETILQVVKTYDHPLMINFTSADRKALFLENVLELVKKLAHRDGAYRVDSDGDIVYNGTKDTKRGFGKIREIVGQWFYSDISFLVTHLPRLQKEGFFSFTQLFEKQMPESSISLLKDLFLRKTLNAESQISAALILIHQKSEKAIDEKERGVILDSLFDILMSGKEKFGLVGVSSKAFDSVRTENAFYYSALESFYRYVLDHGGLSNKQGIALFENETLKMDTLKDESFEKIEALRLRVVAKSLDYEVYRSEMLKRLTKGTSYSSQEQMRVASLLANTLADKDRPAAGKLIKDRYKEGMFRSKTNWEAEGGWPVQLMMKVNPRDPEMIEHLVSVASEQRIDSIFPVGDVLGYLVNLKVSSPKIKNLLQRHLRFPEAGDSVNYFQTLVKLHPEAVSEIVAIVHRFRGDTAKLIPMLKVLLEEVIKNPTLLAGIVADIKQDPRKVESSRVYNGLNLAEILTVQVQKHNRTSCRRFYSDR